MFFVASYRSSQEKSKEYFRCQLLAVTLKSKVDGSLVADAKPETKKVIILSSGAV